MVAGKSGLRPSGQRLAYIQELATICQRLAPRLQRPVRLLEVGTRTGRAAESLLTQLNAEQIEYVGLEHSDAAERPAEAFSLVRRPAAPLACRHAGGAYSADIIWLNSALHRLLPEDPALLATLQQLAAPGALLYVMEFRQLTPSALLSTLLLTDGQPEALLHNSADWAALFTAAAFNCQHGDEVRGVTTLPRTMS